MNERIIVIGKVDDTSGTRVLIQYEAQSGTRHEWVPKEAIVRQEPLSDGRTAFVLGSHSDNAIAQDQFKGPAAPMVNDGPDIAVVSALENGEKVPEVSFDDSRPVFQVEAAPTIIITGEDGEDVLTDVWGGALLSGGRFDTICDWDFEPVMLPAYVPVQEGKSETMSPRMQRANKENGETAVYLGFNPNFKSAREPAGALLGTYSDRYYALSYPKVFRPILQKSAENGWQASVLAFKRGKQARLDCDVTGAVHHAGTGYGTGLGEDWSTVAEPDSGWLAPETVTGLQEQVHKMWRYGFSIHNSLDGRGSFRVQAVARRLACTNAGVIGGQQTIHSLRHTEGNLGEIDWDEFATTIDSVIVDAQRGLGHVEALKNVRLEDQAFQRLLTLSERAGLVAWPRPKKDGELIGNHMWELFGHGWTNPSEPWVRAGEDQGTLFHAYQVMTGAITHKPEWKSKNRILKGSTLQLSSVDDRLRKVDALFTGLGTATMKGYSKTIGRPIAPEDWSDFHSFVSEEGVTGLGDRIPTASEVLSVLHEG